VPQTLRLAGAARVCCVVPAHRCSADGRQREHRLRGEVRDLQENLMGAEYAVAAAERRAQVQPPLPVMNEAPASGWRARVQ
jgi:hypothetical protein